MVLFSGYVYGDYYSMVGAKIQGVMVMVGVVFNNIITSIIRRMTTFK